MGQIQAIDHFGNLITTIPATAVPTDATVMVGDRVAPIALTYGAASWGSLVALIGSHGWLEVAVNGGSAQAQTGAQVGDRVSLQVGFVNKPHPLG